MAIPNTAADAGARDAAFAEIVHSHQALVYSIALRYLRNPSAAEEVAQDVFLQLHRQWEKLESPGHAAAWLRKVTCHRAIDVLRRRKFESPTSLEDTGEPVAPAVKGDPMLRRKIHSLVATLPEKARMVMILRYQEDLDPEEIASTLAMPVRTVKSHLQRSIQLLREKVGRVMQARTAEQES